MARAGEGSRSCGRSTSGLQMQLTDSLAEEDLPICAKERRLRPWHPAASSHAIAIIVACVRLALSKCNVDLCVCVRTCTNRSVDHERPLSITCMCKCTCACAHISWGVHMRTSLGSCTMQMRMHIRTYSHTYIYTHTYTSKSAYTHVRLHIHLPSTQLEHTLFSSEALLLDFAHEPACAMRQPRMVEAGEARLRGDEDRHGFRGPGRAVICMRAREQFCFHWARARMQACAHARACASPAFFFLFVLPLAPCIFRSCALCIWLYALLLHRCFSFTASTLLEGLRAVDQACQQDGLSPYIRAIRCDKGTWSWEVRSAL